MSNEPVGDHWTTRSSWKSRCQRLAVVIGGLVVCQVVLFWPSLIGQRLLLPLDLLASPRIYLPNDANSPADVTSSAILSDQILDWEFSRRLATSELQAGRLPIWNPYSYCGSPTARWELYCPFNVIYYLWPSPVSLAWIQLILSAVAGLGAYLFFVKCQQVRFWPATIGAWCYPLTGYFVLWQGYPLAHVVAWFGWVLLFTDRAIRRPSGWGGPLLGLFTACAVASRGEVAAQLLLASGMYAIWCFLDAHRGHMRTRQALSAMAACCAGWCLGLMLSAPYLWPMVDYSQTGSRLKERADGMEERPPVGLDAIPQVVLPNIYGTDDWDSLRIVSGNRLESSATAYAGLLATLLVAPLGWCSQRHRSINRMWLIVGFIGVGWAFNVPGLVALLRLPGINLLAHNRFVFVTAFAILATAVNGLDVMFGSTFPPQRRSWFGLPLAILIILGARCIYRTINLPDRLTNLELLGYAGPKQLEVAFFIRWNFTRVYFSGAVLCSLGAFGWISALIDKQWELVRRLVGLFLLGELLWFAYGVSPQTERELYFPRLPVFEALSKNTDGRVLAVNCFPARLQEAYGLRDLRGYDGVDPQRLVDVMELARHPKFPANSFGKLQWYRPNVTFNAAGEMKIAPVLSMLNLRYLIWREKLPEQAQSLYDDGIYAIVENPRYLPRTYVPRTVESVPDDAQRLKLLASDSFDARQVAYVEEPVPLHGECRGTARIVSEIPTRITLDVDMETAGLVVLADLWDRGWNAYLNEQLVPILRTNHAIRGVMVPAGRATLTFRYEPASLTRGIRLFLLSSVCLAIWCSALGLARFTSRQSK